MQFCGANSIRSRSDVALWLSALPQGLGLWAVDTVQPCGPLTCLFLPRQYKLAATALLAGSVESQMSDSLLLVTASCFFSLSWQCLLIQMSQKYLNAVHRVQTTRQEGSLQMVLH